MVNKQDNYENLKFMLGFLIVLLILFFSAVRCCAQTKTKAQIDTMVCHSECIDKYVEATTSNGKVHYYAVYNDTKNDVSELIPVTQSVMSYIKLCNENGIKPSLGIKLRNGQIQSLIKYKPRYIRKK